MGTECTTSSSQFVSGLAQSTEDVTISSKITDEQHQYYSAEIRADATSKELTPWVNSSTALTLSKGNVRIELHVLFLSAQCASSSHL